MLLDIWSVWIWPSGQRSNKLVAWFIIHFTQVVYSMYPFSIDHVLPSFCYHCPFWIDEFWEWCKIYLLQCCKYFSWMLFYSGEKGVIPNNSLLKYLFLYIVKINFTYIESYLVAKIEDRTVDNHWKCLKYTGSQAIVIVIRLSYHGICANIFVMYNMVFYSLWYGLLTLAKAFAIRYAYNI